MRNQKPSRREETREAAEQDVGKGERIKSSG